MLNKQIFGKKKCNDTKKAEMVKILMVWHGNYADASKESSKYKGCREKDENL